MIKILTTTGILCLMAVLFLPLYANFTGGDAFSIIDTSWYKPLLYTGFGLVCIPPILSTIFSLRTVTSGEPAVGLIRHIQQTGTYINEQPQLLIEVMVTRHGQEPYPASFKAIIPQTAMPQFQPGSVIPLLVSAKHPSQVGLDRNGQVSQYDMQSLLNEQMIRQGVDPKTIEIARHGEQLYAKVLDVVHLGNTHNGKLSLQFTLSLTRSNGETRTIHTQKDIFESNLSQLQQGHIIRVMYSEQCPDDVALMLSTGEQDLQRAFGGMDATTKRG
ncbi:hypothetical protein [Paenibacillus sp. WLX2291]|uniref:hypothetical protein n=1 Tax=Paenibacillus sp. WLX2291 TaxID=3296934 RepID=UPI003983E91D